MTAVQLTKQHKQYEFIYYVFFFKILHTFLCLSILFESNVPLPTKEHARLNESLSR